MSQEAKLWKRLNKVIKKILVLTNEEIKLRNQIQHLWNKQEQKK